MNENFLLTVGVGMLACIADFQAWAGDQTAMIFLPENLLGERP